MTKLTIAALLATTLLAPVAAFADSQCTSLPDADAAPPAATPGPVKAQAAPRAGSSAADAFIAAGVPEATAAQIAGAPGLGPVIKSGARIFVIGERGGALNFMAVNGNSFQAFTPLGDPHYLCRGMIQDDNGESVTLAEASRVPGLVPTKGASIASITTADQALAAIAGSAYGTFGPEGAPTVWAVIDPMCIHSQQTIKDLISYAKKGQIRINFMPVPVLGRESVRPTQALLTGGQDDMMNRWFNKAIMTAPIDDASGEKLMRNNGVFAGLREGLHITGVPALFWKAGGVAHAQAGIEQGGVPAFVAALGR